MLRILLVYGLTAVLLVWSEVRPGYLDFDNLPETNFSCEGKVIGGYYADVETGCQMFHVCTIGQKGEVSDIKFLCLNGTVFDQETRVCERIDEVDCDKSESFFGLNLQLYGNGGGIQPEDSNNDNRAVECEECEEDEEVEYEDEEEEYTTTTTTTTSTTSTTTTTPRPTTTAYSALSALLSHHGSHYAPTTRRPSINLSLRTKFSAESRQPTFRPFQSRPTFRPYQPTPSPTPLRANYHHFSSGDTQFTHSFDPETPYHFQYFKSSPSPFRKSPEVSIVTSTSTSTSVKVSNSSEFEDYDIDPFFQDVPKLRSKRSSESRLSQPAENSLHQKLKRTKRSSESRLSRSAENSLHQKLKRTKRSSDHFLYQEHHPNHKYPEPYPNHNMDATMMPPFNISSIPDFVIQFTNGSDKSEYLNNLLSTLDLESIDKEMIGEIIKDAEPEVENAKKMGVDMMLETLENKLTEGSGNRDKRDQMKEYGRAKRESLDEIPIFISREYDLDVYDPKMVVVRHKREAGNGESQLRSREINRNVRIQDDQLREDRNRNEKEFRRRIRVRVKDNTTKSPPKMVDIKPVTEEIEDDVTTAEYRRHKTTLRPREVTTYLPPLSTRLQTRYEYNNTRKTQKKVSTPRKSSARLTPIKSFKIVDDESEEEASASDEHRVLVKNRSRTETFIPSPLHGTSEEETPLTTPTSTRGQSRVRQSRLPSRDSERTRDLNIRGHPSEKITFEGRSPLDESTSILSHSPPRKVHTTIPEESPSLSDYLPSSARVPVVQNHTPTTYSVQQPVQQGLWEEKITPSQQLELSTRYSFVPERRFQEPLNLEVHQITDSQRSHKTNRNPSQAQPSKQRTTEVIYHNDDFVDVSSISQVIRNPSNQDANQPSLQEAYREPTHTNRKSPSQDQNIYTNPSVLQGSRRNPSQNSRRNQPQGQNKVPSANLNPSVGHVSHRVLPQGHSGEESFEQIKSNPNPSIRAQVSQEVSNHRRRNPVRPALQGETQKTTQSTRRRVPVKRPSSQLSLESDSQEDLRAVPQRQRQRLPQVSVETDSQDDLRVIPQRHRQGLPQVSVESHSQDDLRVVSQRQRQRLPQVSVESNSQDDLRVVSQRQRQRLPQKVAQRTQTPQRLPSRSETIQTNAENIPQDSPTLRDYHRDSHMQSSHVIGKATAEIIRTPSVETTTTSFPFYQPEGFQPDPDFSCKERRKGALYADVYADCLGFFICTQGKKGLRESHFWCGEGTRFSSESGTCVSGRLVKCGDRLIPQEQPTLPPHLRSKEVYVQPVLPVVASPHPGYEKDPDFSCDGKVKGGHYADIYANCYGFFICTQGQRGLVNQHFWCGSGTKFNQKSLTCQTSRLVDCRQASRYFPLDASPGLLDVYEEERLRGGFESSKT